MRDPAPQPDVIPSEFEAVAPEVLARQVEAWKAELARWKATERLVAEGNTVLVLGPEPLPPLNAGQRAFCRERLLPALFQLRRYRARGLCRRQYAPQLVDAFHTLHFVWGPGGVGKTEMLKVLEQVMLRECFGRVCFAAWMGVAGGLLPHGTTLCQATGLKPVDFARDDARPEPTPDQRITFETLCGPPEELSLVVIDEVSTLSPNVLQHSSERFDFLVDGPKDPDVPFGGLLVLLLGDFLQLPPVMATPLYKAAVNKLLGGKIPSAYGKRPTKAKVPRAVSVEGRGTDLFIRFKVFFLTEQMRARDDEQHCLRLEALRNLNDPKPLTEDTVRWLYSRALRPEHLSHPDVVFARMATVSAKESAEHNLRTTMAYARYRGFYVFRWKRKIPEPSLPYVEKPAMERLYEEERAELYHWWVADSPGIILKNFPPGSIGQQLHLANGTSVRNASLTLAEGALDRADVLTEEGVRVVTLREQPLSINVQLIIPVNQRAYVRESLGLAVSGAGAVVVPIKRLGGYQRKTKLSSVHAAAHGYRAELQLNQELPTEVSWSNTDHKYQGVTIREDRNVYEPLSSQRRAARAVEAEEAAMAAAATAAAAGGRSMQAVCAARRSPQRRFESRRTQGVEEPGGPSRVIGLPSRAARRTAQPSVP